MSIYIWHDAVFQQLARRAGALPHALLLKGPLGIGKRGFAAGLARGLLCETPAAPLIACGGCQACHWLESDGHPDHRCLQPEADEATDEADISDKKKKLDISIAQVRSLSNFINISAHRGRAKVVVIQPAEAMNANAANALLKSLEEPPPDTFFILVSHRPQTLPATIRSRCQQLALRPPTIDEAMAWLAKHGTSQPELALAQAGGSPLLAVELDNPEYWSAREQFLSAVAAREFNPLAAAESLASQPVPQTIHWLQRWTYDLSRASCGQGVRYNPDRSDFLLSAAKRMNYLNILRFHRELVKFQRVINHPLNPRLLLEDVLLRYQQMGTG